MSREFFSAALEKFLSSDGLIRRPLRTIIQSQGLHPFQVSSSGRVGFSALPRPGNSP